METKPKILIVEDDEDIARIQVFNLEAWDMEAKAIAYGGGVFHAIRQFAPDLVIIDIMLPDVEGFEIIKALRSRETTSHIPIIVITARDGESDRLKGLELGADDYMVKPFSPKEMVLRVKAVLKRTYEAHSRFGTKAQPLSIKRGPLEVDPKTFTAMLDGEPMELTRKEFDLLYYLLKNHGIVLTRERLMEDVWGYTSSVYSRTVDTHIRRLRQKMGRCASSIRTVRGLGYKFELASS